MPIEAWEIDKHDTVDFPSSETAFGDVGDAKELAELGEHFGDPDDGHAGKIEIQIQSGLDHSRAAEAPHATSRVDRFHALDQARCVQVSAWFSHREEDPLSHRFVECIGEVICHEMEADIHRFFGQNGLAFKR
jgi:hypothetical protein